MPSWQGRPPGRLFYLVGVEGVGEEASATLEVPPEAAMHRKIGGIVKKTVTFFAYSLFCFTISTGCANTETTEEECDAYLRSLAYFSSVSPTGTIAAKAKEDGILFSSTIYLYCKNQIPAEDPLDRATGINLF
ncbi:MAG: hypothetical protein F9K24_04690 [Leptonema illini]|jgi:hypothetical protein|uniref:Uncharacterized protein n=1 Tax=Leptonema illini TaxID=183 RepID=A0A833LZL7_9LEPT|nr:MAG: hypothetical protein F9K24_04690 [Leptonema illini]